MSENIDTLAPNMITRHEDDLFKRAKFDDKLKEFSK